MGTGVAITSRPALAGAIRASDRAAPRSTTTASLSDEELAGRAQRGCVDSFEQLMRRFQAPVLHFLRRRGRRRSGRPASRDFHSGLCQPVPIPIAVAFCHLAFHDRPACEHYLSPSAAAPRKPRGGHCVGRERPARPGRNRRGARTAAGTCGIGRRKSSRKKSRRPCGCITAKTSSMRDIAAVLGVPPPAVKTMFFRSRKRLVPLLAELTPDGATDPVVRDAEERIIPDGRGGAAMSRIHAGREGGGCPSSAGVRRVAARVLGRLARSALPGAPAARGPTPHRGAGVDFSAGPRCRRGVPADRGLRRLASDRHRSGGLTHRVLPASKERAWAA